MPSARSILILWKPSSFMKCSWPGLRCALNRSVMRATSIAFACSTLIRSGLAMAVGDNAGAPTMVRAFVCSGLAMTVISEFSWSSHLFGGDMIGGDGKPVFLGAVFAVGGDQHVLVAILRHPAELALGLGYVEHALLIGDQILF